MPATWPPAGAWRWQEVDTDELDNPAYARNDGDRCYWCKDALLAAAGPAGRGAGATVVLGVNVDDLGDHRPGQRAAAERGAAFPLVDAGFTKADVRAASTRLGLRDVGQAGGGLPRLPAALRHAGDPRSPRPVERAEAGAAGARVSRSCGSATTARWPASRCPRPTSPRVVAKREAVVEAVVAAGYRWATLDLAGLRVGRLQPAAGRSTHRLQVGKVMWGTSRCSTIRPLAARRLEARPGSRPGRRPSGCSRRPTAAAARTRRRHRRAAARRRPRGWAGRDASRVDAPAVVDDALEHGEGTDPHGCQHGGRERRRQAPLDDRRGRRPPWPATPTDLATRSRRPCPGWVRARRWRTPTRRGPARAAARVQARRRGGRAGGPRPRWTRRSAPCWPPTSMRSGPTRSRSCAAAVRHPTAVLRAAGVPPVAPRRRGRAPVPRRRLRPRPRRLRRPRPRLHEAGITCWERPRPTSCCSASRPKARVSSARSAASRRR